MIDTFNLELNLLTFPSERDILTGGMGKGTQGEMDGSLQTRPAHGCRGRGSRGAEGPMELGGPVELGSPTWRSAVTVSGQWALGWSCHG